MFRRAVAMAARVVASEFAFCQSLMEVIAGAYALAALSARFERLYGTRKTIGCACVARALTAACRACASSLSRSSGSDSGRSSLVVCGPYGLTFALLAMYACEIPATHRFDVFGATLSEKAFMYASGVMLAMSDGQASMLEAVCGLFAGYVISCGVGSESDVFVAPAFVARLFGGDGGTTVRVRAAAPRAGGGGGARPGAPDVRRDVEPSEANVRTLVSMGFDEDAVRRALRRSGDDVQRATGVLLNT